jgi:hypothetical protein
MTEEQLERFEDKVLRSGFDACWHWAASKDTHGYGHIRLDYKLTKAHRASYEHFVGPIPTELQLDHLCRNRGCVNPKHLEPVTVRENVLRGNGGGAHARKTHCIHGHEYTPENTYKQTYVNKDGLQSGRSCRECKLKKWRKGV